jgi:hypothetical protein
MYSFESARYDAGYGVLAELISKVFRRAYLTDSIADKKARCLPQQCCIDDYHCSTEKDEHLTPYRPKLKYKKFAQANHCANLHLVIERRSSLQPIVKFKWFARVRPYAR